MDKVSELAHDMAKQVSDLIKNTDQYKDYQQARDAIYADKDLYKKVYEFFDKHMQFLYDMKNGTATFEQERYLSQEFHKLTLNKNVHTYITLGLYFVEMLADFYTTSVEGLEIDLEF